MKSVILLSSVVPLFYMMFEAEFSTKDAVRMLGNGSRATAQDTVPFCLWVVATYGMESWEEALWQTASAIGDVDTNCAIVGAPEWMEARESFLSFVKKNSFHNLALTYNTAAIA